MPGGISSFSLATLGGLQLTINELCNPALPPWPAWPLLRLVIAVGYCPELLQC